MHCPANPCTVQLILALSSQSFASQWAGCDPQDQLGALTDSLGAAGLQFVRCILPNVDCKPGVFAAPLVLDQLRHSHLVDDVRVYRKGFPDSLQHTEFVRHYGGLASRDTQRRLAAMQPREAIMAIAQDVQLGPHDLAIGSSKVFFRADVLSRLDDRVETRLSDSIVGLQARVRGFLTRREHSTEGAKDQAALVIQRAIRAHMVLRQWSWGQLFLRLRPVLGALQRSNVQTSREREMQAATAKLQTLHDALQDADATVAALEQRRQELTQALHEDSRDYQEFSALQAKLLACKQDLQDNMAASEEALSDARTAQHKMALRAAELKGTETRLMRDIADANAADALMTRYTRDLAETDAAVAQLTQAVADGQRGVDDARRRTQDMQRTVDALEDQLAAANKAARQVQASLDDAAVALVRETSAASANKARVTALNERKAKLIEQQHAAEAGRQQAVTETAQAEQRAAALEKDIEVMRKKVAKREADRVAAIASVDKTIERAGAQAKAVAEAHAAQRTLKSAEEDLQLELDHVHTQRVAVDIQLRAARQAVLEREAAAAAAADLRRRHWERQLGALQDELAAERQGKAAATDRRAQLQADFAGLEARLAEEERQLARCEQTLAAAQSVLDADRVMQTRGKAAAPAAPAAPDLGALRQQLANLDVALNDSVTERRRATQAREEHEDMVATLQAEVQALMRKLGRA